MAHPLRSQTLRRLTAPTSSIPSIQTRSYESARRARKSLNIPPAPSFTAYTSAVDPSILQTTGSSGRSRLARLAGAFAPTHDHIIFNPAPAVPNPYHTPSKFLPPDDVRRLHRPSPSSSTSTAAATTPSSLSSSSRAADEITLPPRLRPNATGPKYSLSEADVAEMRALHAQDPIKWTRRALAKKFDCSNHFAMLCLPSTKDSRERRAREQRRVQSFWGPRKREAMRLREKRREMWTRDE